MARFCIQKDETEDSAGKVIGALGSSGAPGGAEAGNGTPRHGDSERMALSVTRHALISCDEESGGIRAFRFLACGIDTLDVGYYIDWRLGWPMLLAGLEAGKTAAVGSDAVPWGTLGGELALIYPSGKPPVYRFHLQLPYAHLYIAQSQTPRKSPNLYVSFGAKTLWIDGVRKSLEKIRCVVEELNGHIERIQPSRCDLAVDYLIPEGLTTRWLQEQIVCRATKTNVIEDDGILETFYIGVGKSPILARFYNKTKQILKTDGKSAFFLSVWKLESPSEVWRVEFQMRRPFLRQMQIDDIESLLDSRAGLWRYLTGEWFTLRLPDNPNTSRRSVHPWWLEVQACADCFAGDREVRRNYETEKNHCAQRCKTYLVAYLSSFAALRDIPDFASTIDQLCREIDSPEFEKEFLQKVAVKRVKFGIEGQPDEVSGPTYPPDWDAV